MGNPVPPEALILMGMVLVTTVFAIASFVSKRAAIVNAFLSGGGIIWLHSMWGLWWGWSRVLAPLWAIYFLISAVIIYRRRQ